MNISHENLKIDVNCSLKLDIVRKVSHNRTRMIFRVDYLWLTDV